MPTKYFKDFCPGSLLEGRAEIHQIFGSHFGRNDDLMNSLSFTMVPQVEFFRSFFGRIEDTKEAFRN